MIGSVAAWRRMLKLWLPGLVLLIANMGVLSGYRFLLAGQAQLRSSRVERLSAELAELQTHQQALDEVMAAANLNRLRVEEFYGRWLSSEADRLTQVITEVKRMARVSGVKTSGFRYPNEVLEEFDLVRRSIVFSVEGSYKELRRFVYSLEHSDQFLILEEIGVSDSSNKESDIRVPMRVSTLFLSGTGGPEA